MSPLISWWKPKSAKVFCLLLMHTFLVVPAAVGQETENDLIREINRIQFMLNSARGQIVTANGWEPTAEQKEAMESLEARRSLVDQPLADAFNQQVSIDDRMERMKKIRGSLEGLEKELREGILMPHQVTWLDQSEFKRVLDRFNGDYAVVFNEYYPDQFGITKKQREDLVEVRNRGLQKIRVLQSEFNQKQAEVEKETRAELAKIFTLKQIEIIERLSGEKLVEVPDPNEEKDD